VSAANPMLVKPANCERRPVREHDCLRRLIKISVHAAIEEIARAWLEHGDPCIMPILKRML
jgi:hypothetical protein